MGQETFPPERPFGRSEGEHDEVRGYDPLAAVEGDAAVAPIDEPPPSPQAPPEPARGTDDAA